MGTRLAKNPAARPNTARNTTTTAVFFTSTPHNRVDYVLLAGGSASLPGLTSAVTRQTSFACSLVNPFDGMEIGSSIREKKVRREAPSYLTSCGLAMRRFMQ